jgi:ketopantoate reductase
LIAEGIGGKEVAMLLDLKKRRLTEAESTIGLMVKNAKEAGIPVPYTECAWRLIHSIESTF